ncbi:phosphodiesterase [Actinomycetes bacterium KLBMP 9797]
MKTSPPGRPTGSVLGPGPLLGAGLGGFVDGSVSRVVEAVTDAVAAARHARALHPRGRTFRATVSTLGGGGYGVDLLDRAGHYQALVRLSRGAGLPEPWPDVLGIAVRVRDGGGPGVDLDLLTSTAVARAPLARHVPMLRRRLAVTYTTLAGYDTRHGRRYLAVLPDPAARDLGAELDTLTILAVGGRVRFLLAIAAPFGGWRVFGRVVLGEPVTSSVDQASAFDPVVRAAPGLRTDGLLWRLRAAAYRGSRRGRGRPAVPDDQAAGCR